MIRIMSDCFDTCQVSTSAGLRLPVLKDVGEESSRFGQLVMTAAALAEVGPIVLLSLFSSATSSTAEARLALWRSFWSCSLCWVWLLGECASSRRSSRC